MTKNKFNVIETQKVFSKDLVGKFINVTGADDEGTLIDVTGRVFKVEGDRILVDGWRGPYHNYANWTFFLSQFERGTEYGDPASDAELFDTLFLRILEVNKEPVDFSEGG